MCSSVVYSFKCPGCHALHYGKTTRNLVTRCREHLGINKAGQKIKSNCSSIGDHISKSGHNGFLDDFNILSKTENSFDLLIHESLLILRDHPSLNSQQSSNPLLLFWVVCLRSSTSITGFTGFLAVFLPFLLMAFLYMAILPPFFWTISNSHSV